MAFRLLRRAGMTPLLISGIASIASSAIDAWSNASQRRAALQQAKFDQAFNQAMGVRAAALSTQGPAAMQPTAQHLENQLRNAPEIRGILDAQNPALPASLQVSAEGRVWLQVPGNQPAELVLSQETQSLARQLNAARGMQGTTAARNFSSTLPAAGSLVTLAR